MFGSNSDALMPTNVDIAAKGVVPRRAGGLSASAPSDFSSMGVLNLRRGLPSAKRPPLSRSTRTNRSSAGVTNVPANVASLGRLPSRATSPGSIAMS